MSDNEVFPEVQLSPVKRLDEAIDADEVVWAKWKGVYWPALVRRCDKKQKKAVIVYTDSPCNENGKEMRHSKSFKHLICFDNSSRSKTLMNDESSDENLQAAIQLAKEYVLKRASGNLFVTPLEFFLNPNHNVLADPKATNVKRKIENAKPSVAKRLRTSNESSTDTKKNNTNDVSDSSFTEKEEELDQKLKSIIERIGAKIKDVVESDECKKHLLRVAQNKVSSYRHNYFSYGTLSQRKNLKLLSFDKIVNDSQLSDIIENLKEDLEGKVKVKRNNVLNYILDVMLPEALMFAMQKVLHITKKKADNVLKGERNSELEYDKLILQFDEKSDNKEESTV
ncbi:hypothetical protein CHUAL_011088 [Chamberlinius hualienensis]